MHRGTEMNFQPKSVLASGFWKAQNKTVHMETQVSHDFTASSEPHDKQVIPDHP